MNVTVSKAMGDQGKEYATVKVGAVEFTIHESLIYEGTVNVEIDGDFTGDEPRLRMHLNDVLVLDTVNDVPEAESLPLIRQAALHFLHGEDVSDAPASLSLGALADALGVPHEDVEAL